MNHKIQISVDDRLNTLVKNGAKKMGLSVSSYTRLILLSVLNNQTNIGLLDKAIKDLQSGETTSSSLEEFKAQIDKE